MHYFDIVALCVTALLAGLGIKRGLVGELFRLAAIVVGFAAAVSFYGRAYPWLGFITLPPNIKTALAFLLVYVATAFCVLAIGFVVRKIVHLSLLGWLDRLLGGLTGFIKAAILMWILLLCVTAVPYSPAASALSNSITYRLFRYLPLRINAPSINGKTDILKTAEKYDIGGLKNAAHKISEFRARIDSAKTHADSFRLLDD